MMISSEDLIEKQIASFFRVGEEQIETDNKTLVIRVDSSDEFERLLTMYPEAQLWKGIYRDLHIAFSNYTATLPLRIPD